MEGGSQVNKRLQVLLVKNIVRNSSSRFYHSLGLAEIKACQTHYDHRAVAQLIWRKRRIDPDDQCIYLGCSKAAAVLLLCLKLGIRSATTQDQALRLFYIYVTWLQSFYKKPRYGWTILSEKRQAFYKLILPFIKEDERLLHQIRSDLYL